MTETNLKLAGIFLNLARILGMEDEKKNKFRIIAYQNAARVLQNMTEDITSLVEDNKLPKISGIGEAIQEKILSFLHTGHIPMYDEWTEIYPESFLQIFQIPHIGPKTAKILYDSYQVRSIADLEKLMTEHKLEEHAGFGEKSVTNIREALTRLKKESKRLPLLTVFPTVHKLIQYMERNKSCLQIACAGSLRRFEDTIGDVDLLATSDQPDEVISYFVHFPETKVIQSEGDTKASIIVDDNLQIDLRVVEPKSFGAALQYFTGSKDHNVHLRNIAKDKGLKLNEYGVFRGEENIASETEEDVYRAIGMHYIPPELRRNQGEIEEAIEKPFPEFVTLKSLKVTKKTAHTYTEVSENIWTNYPVLLNRLHEISKAKEIPLFKIAQNMPLVATMQILQRECNLFALELSQTEEWKKEILVGFMRRARIEKKQVISVIFD